MEKKCVENAVTVSVGDGPRQGCFQSCSNCHETCVASSESMSEYGEDGNSYNGFLVSDFRSNRSGKFGFHCGASGRN
jgi:hypothetical protein